MAYQQTKDIFRQSCNFHLELARYYSGVKIIARQPEVKLLLDYLCMHEQDMANLLENFQCHEVSTLMLDAWFDYSPKGEVSEYFKELKVPRPSMKTAEVIDTAVHLNQGLIHFLNDLIRNTTNSSLSHLWMELVDIEENGIKKIFQNSLELEQCC